MAILAKIFPWSDSLIRTPSLLSYLGISIALFFIVKLLTKKSNLAIATIISLSIMPWSIHFSKIGFESHLSVFWLSLSLLFLVKASTKYRLSLYLLSSLSLLLGVYSYIVLRVIGPVIFLLTYLVLNYKKIKTSLKPFLISLSILAVGIIYLTNSPFYQSSQQYRLSNDNLLTTKNHIIASSKAIELSGSTLTNRLLNHRYLYWAEDYLKNYFTYFSPEFLSLTGDPNLRHHTGFGGMLLIPQFLLLLIGLLNLKKLNLPTRLIFLGILFISPAVAALVNETPHASRSIYLILPLSVFIGLGWTSLNSKILKGFIFIALIFNLFIYLNDYHHYYPNRSHLAWITPYKQAFIYLNHKNYGKDIYITDQHYMPKLYADYYLFSSYPRKNLHFSLPDSCPDQAWCIAPLDWKIDTHRVIDIIPGTNDLVVKEKL